MINKIIIVVQMYKIYKFKHYCRHNNIPSAMFTQRFLTLSWPNATPVSLTTSLPISVPLQRKRATTKPLSHKNQEHNSTRYAPLNASPTCNPQSDSVTHAIQRQTYVQRFTRRRWEGTSSQGYQASVHRRLQRCMSGERGKADLSVGGALR